MLNTLTGKVSWPCFARNIRVAMAEDGIGCREAAKTIGISPATLSRITRHSKEPTATNYLKIMDWLGRRMVQPLGGRNAG
jgi:DNA-binding XRE family transcriptional regulator